MDVPSSYIDENEIHFALGDVIALWAVQYTQKTHELINLDAKQYSERMIDYFRFDAFPATQLSCKNSKNCCMAP